jgi:hypothetical protein
MSRAIEYAVQHLHTAIDRLVSPEAPWERTILQQAIEFIRREDKRQFERGLQRRRPAKKPKGA